MSKHIGWALHEAELPNPTPPGMPSTQTLRLVLIYVTDFANDELDLSCWASVAKIAKFSGLSDRQVQKCLATLCELGLSRPGDPQIAADQIKRRDHRPKVWQLCLDGANDIRPVKADGVKTGPNGVNHVRERGERGSPDLLREHLQEQERPERPHEPTQPTRPRRVALSEDFQFDTEALRQQFELPEPLILKELGKLRDRAKAKAMRSADWHATARWWIGLAKDHEAKIAARSPNVTNLYGQRPLFMGETAEQKAARQAAERAERDARIAEQFARRDAEDAEWARLNTPEMKAKIAAIRKRGISHDRTG